MKPKEQEVPQRKAPHKELSAYMPPDFQVEDLAIEQNVLSGGSGNLGQYEGEYW